MPERVGRTVAKSSHRQAGRCSGGIPAITHGNGNVWISSLAVPDSKFPPTGEITGSLTPYLGGACVARSTNEGQDFEIHSCLSNSGHFYDGGNMEWTADGSIWATYWDFDTGRVALWRSSSGGPFTLIDDDPFPDSPDTAFVEGQIAGHPRLRALRGSSLPVLYLAAPVLEESNTLAIHYNRYFKDCATCSFHWGFPIRAVPNVVTQPTIDLAPWEGPKGPEERRLRAGPQYSYDVLRADSGSPPGVDENPRSGYATGRGRSTLPCDGALPAWGQLHRGACMEHPTRRAGVSVQSQPAREHTAPARLETFVASYGWRRGCCVARPMSRIRRSRCSVADTGRAAV